MVSRWRVYWVPAQRVVEAIRVPALGDWEDLEAREVRAGIRPGTPILLSPNCQIDGRLSHFLTRSSFARLDPETKRNYTTDYCVFFDSLWSRGKKWDEATSGDLWDFEDWRTRSVKIRRRWAERVGTVASPLWVACTRGRSSSGTCR